MTKRLTVLPIIVLSAFLMLTALPISADDENAAEQKPCTQPEASQLDFWIGEWNATWQDTVHGSNKITKILGGCVILEQFDGNPGMELKGMSVSTWNPRKKQWQQTWVDNSGGYLDFVGGMDGDRMILSREFTYEGKTIMQRMIFENITDDSFDWIWQRSTDKGENWETLWKIDYTRK
jgi:hypothetical protein